MRIRTHNKEKKQENMETEHIIKTQMIPLMNDVQYQKLINKSKLEANDLSLTHVKIIFCSI